MPACSIPCAMYTAQSMTLCFSWYCYCQKTCLCTHTHKLDTQVTLLIPWLNQDDQAVVFHNKHSFDTPAQQTECIKQWLRKRTGFDAQCQIQYYPGRYDTRLLGIFPVGDLTVYIPSEKVCQATPCDCRFISVPLECSPMYVNACISQILCFA